MGGRRGRRIVRSARSRLRSRKAGEWDIAGWLSQYTPYEYKRQVQVVGRLCAGMTRPQLPTTPKARRAAAAQGPAAESTSLKLGA